MDHLSSATGPSVRPFMSENPKRNALIATGALGGAALLVAAYAATAIFVPAIRGSLSQTGAIILASTTGATALVVGGLTIYVARSKHTGSSGREAAQHQTSIDWSRVQPYQEDPELGASLIELYRQPGVAETTPDFARVNVNGRTYHFGGIEPYLAKQGEYTTDTYVSQVSRFDVVVNLLGNEEQQNYIKTNNNFKQLYPTHRDYPNCLQCFYSDSTKGACTTLYYSSWPESYTLCVNSASHYYDHVRTIMFDASSDKRVYIHGYTGLKTPATFIILCEIERNWRDIGNKSNDQIRGFIANILPQLAAGNPHLLPTPDNLQVLLSDEFLDRLKEKSEALQQQALRKIGGHLFRK